MTKGTRLIIFIICIVLFFLLAPYLVLYSLGYRVDFVHWQITATGGIYVKAEPTGTQITIDGKITDSNGIFADYVFTQNLIPGDHAVSITKEGYHPYHKTLPVKENEVTKLEHVTLFKENTAFTLTADTEQFATLTKKALGHSPTGEPTDQFVLRNNNLYYAATPENAALTATQKATPLIRNVLTWKAENNAVLWLGTNGLLHTFSLETKESEALSAIPLKIDKTKTYALKTLAGNTFVLENAVAWLYDMQAKVFTPFYESVTDLAASPDNQKIAYWNAKELRVWTPKAEPAEQHVVLQKTVSPILAVQWINNDYVIFVTGNRIIISEIDARGNVNTITLPSTITNNTQTVTLKNPKIYFNPADKKLYILHGETLLISERLVP